jgi:hypothetical protein
MKINLFYQNDEDLKKLAAIKRKDLTYFYPGQKGFIEKDFLDGVVEEVGRKSHNWDHISDTLRSRYSLFRDTTDQDHMQSLLQDEPRGLSVFIIDIRSREKELIDDTFLKIRKIGYKLVGEPLKKLGVLAVKVPPLIAVDASALEAFLVPLEFAGIETPELDVFYGDGVLRIPETGPFAGPELAEGKSMVWPPDKDLGIDKARLRKALKSIKVAVIDTGISDDHPDLRGLVKEKYDVTGEGDKDGNGHGTWCGSAIGGTGSKSDRIRHPFYERQYEGIAPGVQLHAYKFLNRFGRGTTHGALKCLERAAERDVDITSNSWGGGVCRPEPDITERAVNVLYQEYGILTAVSAGNSGPAKSTLTTPAGAQFGIAIGAIDRAKAVAGFSSRGPHPSGGFLKPDAVSLGVDVVGARAEGTAWPPITGNEWYSRVSGTSMAAPQTAAILALLLALRS